MDVKEKLVELILNADNDKNLGWYDLYDLTHEKTGCAEYFSDYLIAHGVTVQEWISTDERMPTKEDAPTEYVFTAYANGNCYNVDIALWDTVIAHPDLYDYWMQMTLPQPPKGE